MTPQEKQIVNWTSIAGIILAIIVYFITGWVDSLIILAVLAMFIGWTVLPKVSMCVVYHTIMFGLVGYIIMTVWTPLISGPWYYIDWLRIFLVGLTVASLVVGLGLSISSCFTSKALTETQIGQWTFAGWMPIWGSDMTNSWYGIFTGLPAGMVKVIALEGISKTEKEKKPIQIEIDEDPNKRKFEAEFDFNFMWKIVNTYVFITNKNDVKDLINLILKALTSYLNDSAHKYKEVSMVKLEIVQIQLHIQEALAESIGLYGVEMSNFKLVDIEVPKKQIEQQVADAAAMNAQLAADARELKDTQALDEQVKVVMRKSKKAGSPITYEKAVEIVQTQRKLIQRTAITGNAKPIVITGTGGGKKGNSSTT